MRLVLCQDLQRGIELAQEDFAGLERGLQHEVSKGEEWHRTYLLLSIRHVSLCRVTNKSVSYTRPEPLFDGVHPASDEAIELLLMATHYSGSSRTRLHQLAPELQDQILSHTSLGPVKAAQLGCALGLGTPFTWRYGSREIEVMTHRTHRTEFSHVEQQIWFGDHFSGLQYK